MPGLPFCDPVFFVFAGSTYEVDALVAEVMIRRAPADTVTRAVRLRLLPCRFELNDFLLP